MPPEIVKNGQFDRDAAADALRKFLEDTVRAGKLQLTVSVRVLGDADGAASFGRAKKKSSRISMGATKSFCWSAARKL